MHPVITHSYWMTSLASSESVHAIPLFLAFCRSPRSDPERSFPTGYGSVWFPVQVGASGHPSLVKENSVRDPGGRHVAYSTFIHAVEAKLCLLTCAMSLP